MQCPSCGSKRTYVFSRMGVLRWSRCKDCAHAWRHYRQGGA